MQYSIKNLFINKKVFFDKVPGTVSLNTKQTKYHVNMAVSCLLNISKSVYNDFKPTIHNYFIFRILKTPCFTSLYTGQFSNASLLQFDNLKNLKLVFKSCSYRLLLNSQLFMNKNFMQVNDRPLPYLLQNIYRALYKHHNA